MSDYQVMPPLSDAEFAALKASIAESGILVPVEIDDEGETLDGHHRLRARAELIAEGVPVPDYPRLIRSGLSEVEKRTRARGLNLQRRHLTQEQRRGMIADQIRDCPTWSDARVGRAIGVHNETVAAVRASMPQTDDATDSVASDRVLIDTLGRQQPRRQRRDVVAKTAAEEARAFSVLASADDYDLPAGLFDVRELAGLVKNARRDEHGAAIAAEPPPLPTGPFRVIVADPPWQYGSRASDPTHRARNPYPDMSVEEICALDVGSLAADDCVLWLWTTNAHLREAFDVLDAWDFEHKTMLTWVKDRMGTGDWLRGRTEHCLLAVRGRPIVMLTNQTTVLHGPLRDHSRKPDEFYALVEALCPGSKVELFAREAREGWVAHGSEIAA